MAIVLAFPGQSEFEGARALLASLAAPCRIISPEPAYSKVGIPALVTDSSGHAAILESAPTIICAGWAEYRPAHSRVPQSPPSEFERDIFGEAVIVFFGRCMADETKVRLIAHISGNMEAVFPYINTEMPQACYNRATPCLTFLDEYRMITLYPRRIAVGKTDHLLDSWRVLEKIRCLVNRTWSRRAGIPPCYEMRQKPPALEVYKRLPRTNCRACGELTCMAFAARLWRGEGTPSECPAVSSGEFRHLWPALVEICSGLGIGDQVPSEKEG
jgi:ArsR family metal-binding transcriptional regulator